MARRPRKPRLDQYETLKEASGWYLAAWRDHRELTLEELAAEVGTSKGMVSDLETGALKSNGERAQRFNRDWVDKFSQALGTTGGFLIDVNPFGSEGRLAELSETFRKLSEEDRSVVIELAASLAKRSAA